MGFHHLEKGNAASSEDALALDSLSQPMLPGESVNRKRYIEDCFFFVFFFPFRSTSCMTVFPFLPCKYAFCEILLL